MLTTVKTAPGQACNTHTHIHLEKRGKRGIECETRATALNAWHVDKCCSRRQMSSNLTVTSTSQSQ